MESVPTIRRTLVSRATKKALTNNGNMKLQLYEEGQKYFIRRRKYLSGWDVQEGYTREEYLLNCNVKVKSSPIYLSSKIIRMEIKHFHSQMEYRFSFLGTR